MCRLLLLVLFLAVSAEKGFYKPVSAPATRARLLAPFKTNNQFTCYKACDCTRENSPDCAKVIEQAYPKFPPLPSAACRAIFYDPNGCTVNKTEYVLAPCEDAMCSNRGTCREFNMGPGNGDPNVNETATYCECEAGRQGVKCDEDIEQDEPNECDNDPCNKAEKLGHLCIRQKVLTTPSPRIGHTCICVRGRIFSANGACVMMG